MIRTLCLAALTTALFPLHSFAENSLVDKPWDAKERFMIRARAIAVVPDESNNSTSIGGNIDADPDYVPELDFTYFFTDHVAAELIAAVSKHDVGAEGTALGNLDLGDVYALPPTLTLQYHINPHGKFRPYVGAGLGYIAWFNESSGAVDDIEYDDGISYALHAGLDIGIDEHWAFNMDVKRLFHDVDAKVNGGAVTAELDLDPWVIGVGLGYRF